MPKPLIIIPVDARPVCYQQVAELAAVVGLQIILPPPMLLGMLKQPAPFDDLWAWWESACRAYPDASIILSLDTIAYGGLIAGRVNTESLSTLQQRVERFLSCLFPTHRPRYAFSSILRIPAYNNAQEEPDYWAQYGEALYQLSVISHRENQLPQLVPTAIPADVVTDFLTRRQKNFALNNWFLTKIENHTFDSLVFCQDDTGEFGLNVKEAQLLQAQLNSNYVDSWVQTGADEVALTQLARALWHNIEKPLRVFPLYIPAEGADVLAKFDGQPIHAVVNRHIQAIGATLTAQPEEADLILLVNAPEKTMGDHCETTLYPRSTQTLQALIDMLQYYLPTHAVSLVDLVSANGADPDSMHALFKNNIDLTQLAGFAAWNTPGNSIGTALAMGAAAVYNRQQNKKPPLAQQILLFTRYVDDWLYQAEVRGQLRQQKAPLSQITLSEAMKSGINELKARFGLSHLHVDVDYPCRRDFEIVVEVEHRC